MPRFDGRLFEACNIGAAGCRTRDPCGGEPMTKWPDTDYATIRQFLRHQRLRPASVKTYQPMLAEFQQYVLDNSPEQCVSRPVLEKWLYHRATFSATHTILQRVWPIDCFLDWLADRRLITSNPLADLRKDLGTNDTAEILRALRNSKIPASPA